MKKTVLCFLMIVIAGSLSADNMSVEEWNQLNDEMTTYLADYADRVIRGEAEPIKSGTSLMQYLLANRPAGYNAPMGPFDRMDWLDFTYGTDHFLLHYTDTGQNAVYQFNQQTLVTGIPDYVVVASQALEYVFEHETGDTNFGHLGFPEPLSDAYYTGGGNGGDGRFDVYLAQVGFYGATIVDSQQVTLPLTATTYMFLENDYAGFVGYEGDRNILALQVTAAHEFFHSVQFGIDLGESEPFAGSMSDAWIEMSAVFMEEENYTNVNDYYNYLVYYYAVPQWSLRTGHRTPITTLQNWMNLHQYGAGVWPIFLRHMFDAKIIREIWTRCGDVAGFNWVAATDNAIMHLSDDSLNLGEVYRRFALWNLFTGSWARSGEYYMEAEHYPRPTFAAQISSYPAVIRADVDAQSALYTLVSDSARPDNLGTNYILLNNTFSMTNGMAISLDLDQAQPWKVTVVGLPVNVSDTDQDIWIDSTVYDETTSSILIPNASDFHKIVLILAVTGGNNLKNDYSLNITPLGEGIFSPVGGELAYVGNNFQITWFFADSVTSVEIELSLDNGANWSAIDAVSNNGIYNWTVPNTPSDSCLIRITNADNPSQFDVSDAVFYIRAVDEDRVAEPYPNPAWVQRDENVSFRVEQATGETAEMEVFVAIFNLAGERVKEFPPRQVTGGSTVIQWDFKNQEGETVAAGSYLAVIEFGGTTEVKKFMVLR